MPESSLMREARSTFELPLGICRRCAHRARIIFSQTPATHSLNQMQATARNRSAGAPKRYVRTTRRKVLDGSRAFACACIVSLCFGSRVCFAAAQDTSLPFIGSDSVTVHREGERAVKLVGSIEDITGESLILRRSSIAKTQVLRISDITELSFVRTSDFDRGLQLRQERKFTQALRHFDTAITNEPRSWARNEIQATAVKTCITMGDRNAAVDRIEEILKADPRSRHASLLPLVWDERLTQNERVAAQPKEFQHKSPVRQLAAASSLLDNPAHRAAAGVTLDRIRRTAPSRIADLAAAQLWRVAMLNNPDDVPGSFATWHVKLKHLPLEARGGPQFVVARGLQRQLRYDEASIAFLWLPFMSPTDEALSAMSMLEAVRCLNASGRTTEADVLTQELLARFPETSAAKKLRTETTLPPGFEH